MHREDNNDDVKSILLNNSNNDDDEIDEPIISKSIYTSSSSSSSSSSVQSDIASSSATSSHDIATISIDTIGTTAAFNNIHKITINNNEYDDGSNNMHVNEELVNSITNTITTNNNTIDGNDDVNQNSYDLSNINHFLSLNSSLAYKNDDNNEEEDEVDEPINGIFTNTLITVDTITDHKDDNSNSNNDSKGSSGMVGDHILTAVDDDDDDDDNGNVVMMTEGSIVIPTNNYNMMNVNNTDSTTTNNNNDNNSNYIIPSYCSTEFTEAMSAVTTDCWDISSWLICLEEAEQGRSGATTVIDIYEQIVQKFPRSAKFWKNLIEYHLSNNCMELAEEVMKKSVTVCRSVELWVMYLNYVVGLYNDIINNKVSATMNASTTSTASNASTTANTTTNIASSSSSSIKSLTESASEILKMTPTTVTTTTTTNSASLAAVVVNNTQESILQIRRRCETIFEEACNNVGYSIHAYSIWRLYINFIKSWQEVGMIESGKKLHTLRSTYQRAICVCMEQSDEIWNEYETFEKQQKSNNDIHSSSNSDQALENYLHDFNRKFLHAKSITRERKRLMHGILFDRLASPSTTSNYELQQLDLWNTWIK